MVKVRKNIVPSNIASKVTSKGTNNKKYIVIHETANTNKGANADAHGRLQANGNSRAASWHYTVDDKEVVQSFSDNVRCWHAGNVKYNNDGIGIEICVNSDGDYSKAVDNAVDLVKQLMDKNNISASNVVQHHAASGKDCPKYLRAGSKGITWTQFKSKLSDKPVSKPKPSQPSKKPSKPKDKPKTDTHKANLVVDGYWGKATTRALQQHFNLIADGILSGQYATTTTRALTQNTAHVTGKKTGSPVIRALQKKLKVTQDGLLGPATVKALQKHLGTYVDGKISKPSPMVKALQKALNNGTF